MTRILSVSVVLLTFMLGACGEDEEAKKGYLQDCTTTPSTDCDGAAAVMTSCTKDDCAEGLTCMQIGSGRVCSTPCNIESDCHAADPSQFSKCSQSRCVKACFSQLDCSKVGSNWACNGQTEECFYR